MKHTCKVCLVTSDLAEFYNGVATLCKECHKKRVRQNRLEKADYYKEYDASRFKNDPRVRDRHKRYRKTDAGKESLKKARQKWVEENQEKRAAHVLLGNAVRDNRVTKPSKCESCGSGGRIEGHHEDYAKPLEVTWLCRQCHVDLHNSI